MKIQLKRPLVFLDLETTGLNVASDRIVEICVLKLNLDGTEKSAESPPYISSAQTITEYRMSVANEPKFKEIAKSLAQWMEGCDNAGYNSQDLTYPCWQKISQSRCGIRFPGANYERLP